MHTGHYISGAGHVALIGWVLFGGMFHPQPEPFEMTEVSVISGADYDALVAAQRAPDSATEVAQPEQPDVTPEPPAAPEPAPVTETDAPIEQPQPVQTETPPPDPAPEVVEQTPPTPPVQAEVTDEPPVLDEPVGDTAVLVPEVALRPVPRPVERVAPEPVAQPDPEVTPDPVEQAAVAPDEAGQTEQEPQEAQAPEEATTEIVTEATEAPKASPRPPGRRPPAPAAQPTETAQDAPAAAEPETPAAPQTDAAAIAAAVAAAQSSAETPAPATPTGPPLSAGEKESLRVAVSSCWNVGSLSSEALQTTVVVSVAMNQDGTPITGTIQLESSSGGSDAAAKQAFEAARRAIIRCGAKGYQLPAEKFGQWQNIEMTFNPERMRVK